MEELTNLQQEVLTYIECCIIDDHRPPTLSEIAEHFGWASVTSAKDHLRALERKGYLIVKPKTARGLHVVDMNIT